MFSAYNVNDESLKSATRAMLCQAKIARIIRLSPLAYSKVKPCTPNTTSRLSTLVLNWAPTFVSLDF